MHILKKMNRDEVRHYILNSSNSSKFYIGTDSERLKIDGIWYADYMSVIVVHIDGCHGCKVFGEIVRERDYDQMKNKPSMRLMNEVINSANLYLEFADLLEDREVEIHLDINSDRKFGSSCVVQQAIGYIRGTCNIIPMIKPEAWAASFGADHFKEIARNAA